MAANRQEVDHPVFINVIILAQTLLFERDSIALGMVRPCDGSETV